MTWLEEVGRKIRKKRKRGTNLLTDIHVKKVDLVGIPAIGRGITLFKHKDYEHPTNNLAEVKSAFAALDNEGKAEVVAALTEREAEEDDEVIAKVLRAAGVTQHKTEELEDMSGPINLIKSWCAEIDASGERLRSTIAKSSVGGLTCEAMFAPRFQQMAREVKKANPGMTMEAAESQVGRDRGLGARLFDLAYGSFSDFDADEHLLRIEKANPVGLDRLGALIIKEG